jgi:hypothetical protein
MGGQEAAGRVDGEVDKPWQDDSGADGEKGIQRQEVQAVSTGAG